MAETITLHTHPDLIVEYTTKWAAQIKKEHSPAEAAMAADILTLVKLGHQCLEPAPAESGK